MTIYVKSMLAFIASALGAYFASFILIKILKILSIAKVEHYGRMSAIPLFVP